MSVLTYLDTGVLLARHRGPETQRAAAQAVLMDSGRVFVASEILRFELLPKAIYERRQAEIELYEFFLAGAAILVPMDGLCRQTAFELACRHGLSAGDALHAAAAQIAGSAEILTTELRTKPLHRVATAQLRVTDLWELAGLR